VRILIDELMGDAGLTKAELQDVVGMLGELPDLWDFTHGSWDEDSATSRFKDEAAQEDFVRGFKELTTKPVVGVGRFTSPDTMVRQIKSGVLDLIGCARPSIADPFLPNKIDQGRVEDIRECIGCNICVTGDMTGGLSRCTQNPTFMEEWRKDWHPENMQPKGSDDKVLIVGAGPAGMEAARALGRRGYDVALAEAGTVLGGRVTRESALPGLSAWGRVRDYREGQINQMPNVSVYLDSELDAEQILEFGFENIAIATGSTWCRDGRGRQHLKPMPIDEKAVLYTPDDIMNGNLPNGRVVIFDDDHFYMGSIIAELLVDRGCEITFVTPANCVAEWTTNTLEQGFIQKRMIELGVDIHTSQSVAHVAASSVETNCVYTGRATTVPADAVVLVTMRDPNDAIYRELAAREDEWEAAGIKSVMVLGDAEAPAPIAWATYAGHRYARELDEDVPFDTPSFRREVVGLSTDY